MAVGGQGGSQCMNTRRRGRERRLVRPAPSTPPAPPLQGGESDACASILPLVKGGGKGGCSGRTPMRLKIALRSDLDLFRCRSGGFPPQAQRSARLFGNLHAVADPVADNPDDAQLVAEQRGLRRAFRVTRRPRKKSFSGVLLPPIPSGWNRSPGTAERTERGGTIRSRSMVSSRGDSGSRTVRIRPSPQATAPGTSRARPWDELGSCSSEAVVLMRRNTNWLGGLPEPPVVVSSTPAPIARRLMRWLRARVANRRHRRADMPASGQPASRRTCARPRLEEKQGVRATTRDGSRPADGSPTRLQSAPSRAVDDPWPVRSPPPGFQA